MRKEKRKIILFLLILIFDRILKQYYKTKNSFNLNIGVSFGLFSNKNQNYFYLVSLIILLFLVVLAYKNRKKSEYFLLIFGGASNLCDRICFGGVIDYIKIPLFPIFNIADIMIFIGIIKLLIDLFGKDR